MKTTIAWIFIAASVLLFGYCNTGVAQNQPTLPKYDVSAGVTDAEMAKDIAQIVLHRLLKAEDVKRKQFFEPTLKDGVWTVLIKEAKDRISSPIVIQIRQKTGAIIKYEDPNA
jgi:hypothetical protein